jgi:aryl-alcohol dehydrogenase-like predicted oxidoreductase
MVAVLRTASVFEPCPFARAKESAIAWTLAHPAVTGAIVGARRAKQADGVMNAGTLRLTNQEKAELEAPNEVTV